MSSQRGNTRRRRPQAHQNSSAFKPTMHITNKRALQIAAHVVTGVCQKCKDIVDWKIKFKKYKPMSQPKKCVRCGKKAVTQSYSIVCMDCAVTSNICCKCCQPYNHEQVAQDDADNDESFTTAVDRMSSTGPAACKEDVPGETAEQSDSDEVSCLDGETSTSIEHGSLVTMQAVCDQHTASNDLQLAEA